VRKVWTLYYLQEEARIIRTFLDKGGNGPYYLLNTAKLSAMDISHEATILAFSAVA